MGEIVGRAAGTRAVLVGRLIAPINAPSPGRALVAARLWWLTPILHFQGQHPSMTGLLSRGGMAAFQGVSARHGGQPIGPRAQWRRQAILRLDCAPFRVGPPLAPSFFNFAQVASPIVICQILPACLPG